MNKTCIIESCDKLVLARGLCPMHYSRLRRTGDTLEDLPPTNTPQGDICIIEGCSTDPLARGMCSKHYQRWYKHGAKNGSPYEVQLVRDHDGVCSISDCDEEYYGKGWCFNHWRRNHQYGDPLGISPHYTKQGVHKSGYRFITVPDGRRMLEHRYVMEQFIGRRLERWETVHHIDGIKLNNDISNLQLRSGQHGQGVIHECLDCGSNNIKSVEL